MWQSVTFLNVFNTLFLIQIFWKTKTFFKKLEYSFLVETTKIENTLFSFKTALSEAIVKTNGMATTKWTKHKSGVLPVATLFFWKICFSFRTSQKELIWCTNDPNVHICIFCKRWSFILGCFFPLSVMISTPLSRFSEGNLRFLFMLPVLMK